MSLSQLICGDSSEACVANTTLDHLSASIDRFATKAVAILGSPFDDNSQSFGAFCARVVLENCCAALVGRLDPFRLIYLAEFQAQNNFQYGKPSRSGFKWTGDVLPDDKVPGDLWSNEHEANKVSRALFSQYADHAYWRPAAEAALDAISTDTSSLLAELTSIDPEKYIPEARGRASSIYSTLSKGVHWEFFVSSIVVDEGTLKDAIRDTLLLTAGLGLVSHFIPTSYRRLDAASALAAYKALRGTFS